MIKNVNKKCMIVWTDDPSNPFGDYYYKRKEGERITVGTYDYALAITGGYSAITIDNIQYRFEGLSLHCAKIIDYDQDLYEIFKDFDHKNQGYLRILEMLSRSFFKTNKKEI